MAIPKKNQLYIDLVKVSEYYFGPATDRFLVTQLRNHLNKSPDELTRGDIPKLVSWLGLILAHINADSSTIAEYTERVKRLANPRPKK